MLCAISGEAPQQPVTSRKSGNVFERRLIESYIAENGTDPVNGEELSVDDLIDLKQSRVVKPRPPTLTSIPALLSTFQNEWDAIVLESFTLKQQLSETRQELSTALYYNDAAQRVIARLQKERDEARDALSRITLNANGHSATNGDRMQVDGQSLPEQTIQMIDETGARLSATRRKRPVPQDWATGDMIASYELSTTADTQFTGSRALAEDAAGDFFACGDSDGTIGIYDLKTGAFTTRSSLAAGAILGCAWAHDETAACTSSGAVVVVQDGAVMAKFQQHSGQANDVAVHPSGELLVSVGDDRSYVVYDVASGQVLTQVNTGEELTTVAFHPDGQLLAVGTSTGAILLYDVKTSRQMHIFQSTEGGAPISALAFSENGIWLASSASGRTTVTIWHLVKTNIVTTLDVNTSVTGLSLDYTGQFLAACGPEGLVVKQYVKSSKSWSEVLRKAIDAVDVKWGARASNLAVLTATGSLAVFGA